MNWLLPDYIADALPGEAAAIEQLRRALFDLCHGRGYELVQPPLLEYLDSLLTGAGSDLRLRTFKLVDQLSGRTLGLRADMTPQVARIDAHLLNRPGVTRLCYCGSVLHTLPASQAASREIIQLGAELFGYAGLEADLEIIRLLDAALAVAGIAGSHIDVGHVGVFQALAEAAQLDDGAEHTLLRLLQTRDVPGLRDYCARFAEPWRSALVRPPELYGGDELLEQAADRLPPLPAIDEALATLKRLRAALPTLPLSFDLAELHGYYYHNGIVFTVYAPAHAAVIARGGRYDGVGKSFGRVRPATGFSLDLRRVAQLSAGRRQAGSPIFAPWVPADAALAVKIAALRAQGEIVIESLPGERIGEGRSCDRRLVEQGGEWEVVDASAANQSTHR